MSPAGRPSAERSGHDRVGPGAPSAPAARAGFAGHAEQVVPVGRQVEVQPADEQVVALPVVADLRQDVLEMDDLAGELGECQGNEALCRLAGKVRHRQPELPMLADPQPRDQPAVRLVAGPRLGGLEADGVPEPEALVVGCPQDAAVEVPQCGVGWLFGLAPELDWDVGAGALDLAVA